MEKLAELFKNKKFMMIFSGFIALIGIIILIKNRENDAPKSSELDEIKNKLNLQEKDLKLIKKKNKLLEEKANGNDIKPDSKRLPKPIKSPDLGEEGKGTSTEDDSSDDLDDEQTANDLPV